MSSGSYDSTRSKVDILGLFGFVFLCLAVSAVGGLITATSVNTWYQTLQKPPFNPPDWVFAPVWISLYILMGISAWRIWRLRKMTSTGKPLAVFALQLGLNLAWSYLFFGLQRIDWALLEIIVLLAAIICNALLFWRIDRLAAILFVPYIAWVTYAAVLNASLWLLNN